MMIYLAYISFFLLGMQFINVVLNVVFSQHLMASDAKSNGRISVLIPARNEEKNIGFLLSDLLSTKTSNLEIIVFDDESTDNTAQIVAGFVKQDKKITLIQSDGLPEGWLGKNYACYQLAQKATGQYFLFLDADVRVKGNVIPEMVLYLEKYHLKLLSVFPIQDLRSFGERISVPVMNYILLTLLPLIFVRISPFTSHAAANGQFMLFDASAYRKYQPHRTFKKSAAEDIVIARFLKKQKLKIACLTGEKRIRCRMYQSYREAVNGFSKNVFMFFGNLPVFALVFCMFSAFGCIPVLFALPQYWPCYLVTLVLIPISYSLVSRQNIVSNLLLFPIQQLFFMKIIYKAFITRKNKRLEWKERNIYS